MNLENTIMELIKLNPNISAYKFKSGEDFLDALEWGSYYSPASETYVYVYNDCGSICYYNVSIEKAKELIKESLEFDGEYWGAFLGRGGYIVDDETYEEWEEGDDTPLDWCEYNYEGIWLRV